jgi:hypothetical protein
MAVPYWLDAAGRRVPTHPCVSCGRPAPVMRYPVQTLRQLGWTLGTPTTLVSWCGHENGYVPRREIGEGWFRLVPISGRVEQV